MPRFIVIGIIVVVVIGVVGGVAFFVQQRFASNETELIEPDDSLFGELQPASEGSSQAGLTDDDNDGLVANEEMAWKTDPNNPDSDGDGYLDGEEVIAKHDPTIPAPDDKLLGNAGLNKEEQDLYVAGENLYVHSGNLTENYEQQSSNGEKSIEKMKVFADKQTVAGFLPPPNSALVPVGMPNTADSLARYVSLADNKSALADQEAYNAAQTDLRENDSAAAMQRLAEVIRGYREELLNASVPVSAVDLHKLLLSHTEAVAITIDQVAAWGNDPVKSLVATRQLEVLDRKYYPIIRDELRRLQQLRASLLGASN
jgi:hypothetical protein